MHQAWSALYGVRGSNPVQILINETISKEEGGGETEGRISRSPIPSSYSLNAISSIHYSPRVKGSQYL